MEIVLRNVTHIYQPGGPGKVVALKNINLTIYPSDFLGIIGPTGSGKSTFAQLIDGLLKPTRGEILVDGKNLHYDRAFLRELRKRVGLVFQYPEDQLFEETVYNDIAFGPRNLGLPETEVVSRVKEAMEMVNLDYQEIAARSPFELSGGQKRRIAIAGVVSRKPEILVLDEPFAGLDPLGKKEILGEIYKMHAEWGVTVILISHQMTEVAQLAKRLVVFYEGEIVMSGSPQETFQEAGKLKGWGLGVPPMTALMHSLRHEGAPVRTDIFTVEGAKKEILQWMGMAK